MYNYIVMGTIVQCVATVLINTQKCAKRLINMSMTPRQNTILQLLNERQFITVQELAQLTFTSPSSIRRDLTYLQNNGLVTRSHGGVTLPDPARGVASFHDRRSKSVAEKRLIAKKAAVLLKDNQSILLDGSSTAACMLPHIAKLTGITLFTNNISTALAAIELGIDTHCIGGFSVNRSAVLSGIQAYKAVSEIRPDIFFFSAQSLSKSGVISDPISEENHFRYLALQNAKFSVFLCDSEKFDAESLYELTTVDRIDACVFDKPFPELKTKCKILI